MSDITGQGRSWNKRERKVGTVLSGWTVKRIDPSTGLILWESKSGKVFNVETISPMKIVKKYTTRKEGEDFMDTKVKDLAVKTAPAKPANGKGK